MNKLTLARPYAKAAFSYALATDAMEVWQEFLNVLAHLANHKISLDYLLNPVVAGEKKVEFIFAVYKDLSAKASDQSNQLIAIKTKFVNLLEQNGKFQLLTEIAALYKSCYLSHMNKLEVQVYTPHTLDKKTQDAIAQSLTRRYEKTIAIHSIEDASLIAGIVIESHIERIDASLKGKISSMLSNIQL